MWKDILGAHRFMWRKNFFIGYPVTELFDFGFSWSWKRAIQIIWLQYHGSLDFKKIPFGVTDLYGENKLLIGNPVTELFGFGER